MVKQRVGLPPTPPFVAEGRSYPTSALPAQITGRIMSSWSLEAHSKQMKEGAAGGFGIVAVDLHPWLSCDPYLC